MKEDILEQLVDDYLQAKGYFTRHNLKFLPRETHPDYDSKQDSNHSDIDVLGFHPALKGYDRVVVVSCKSWQTGFQVSTKITELEQNKIVSGREAWRAFRELMIPKWSEAFLAAVRSATSCTEFTYITAVTAIKGDRTHWESYPRFQSALQGNPVRLLALADMLTELLPNLNTTPSNSQLGRTLQLLKAANCSFSIGPETKKLPK
ncbi:MAG: hypothetical protein FJ304_03705 [Planctomycetes bacterium]|nr:hypothetical protein [Planctomycetota bacterium]